MQLWSLVVVTAVLIGAGGSVAYACGGGGGHGGCQGPGDQAGSHDQGGGGQGGNNNCQGQPDLVWQNPSGSLGSARSVSCSLTLTSSNLYLTVSGLLPGQNCTFHAILANIGSATAALSQTISVDQPSACPDFVISDNLPAHPSPNLAPKGTFAMHGALTLSASAKNGCEGAKATFVVTITGTGNSQCDGVPGIVVPEIAVPDWSC